MVEAATQFKRAGFSDEDSANLSVYSTMLQNVSDGILEVGESTDFIISQMKAFDLGVEDAEHIISAVNEVAAHFAISTNDLTTNLSKASAALAVGNNSYEELIGLYSAGYEITRQASRTARGNLSLSV